MFICLCVDRNLAMGPYSVQELLPNIHIRDSEAWRKGGLGLRFLLYRSRAGSLLDKALSF
jgi:hypothetical protein